MAIIVENGSVVSGANSFITEAELTTYLTDRGYSVVASEALLIRSYDFMTSLPWIADHSVNFTVTDKMKKAQAEISYQFGLGFNPSDKAGGEVKSESVDTLSVEYVQGTNKAKLSPYNILKTMPTAFALLQSELSGFSDNRLLRA